MCAWRAWRRQRRPLPCPPVIRLDAATVLLQWSVGGMLFCWFTTRRREVGLGYGWLLRSIYLLLAVGAAIRRFVVPCGSHETSIETAALIAAAKPLSPCLPCASSASIRNFENVVMKFGNVALRHGSV